MTDAPQGGEPIPELTDKRPGLSDGRQRRAHLDQHRAAPDAGGRTDDSAEQGF